MKLARTHYLDASAIVKIFVIEDGSDRIKQYFENQSGFYTTSLCFAEALGVLKSKHFKRGKMSEEEYLTSADELLGLLSAGIIEIEDVNISDRSIFCEVEALARKYRIDISDAFQIVSVKGNYFSQFKSDSKPILITADADLARAARSESLRVWNIIEESEPTAVDVGWGKP